MIPKYGEPTDETDALVQSISSMICELRGSAPARVLSYDATQQRVTVQQTVRVVTRDAETLQPVLEVCQPVANVPVAWLSSAAGAVTTPLAAGDVGMLWVAERSLDEWLQTGATDCKAADPRRFAATDAVFFPGVRPFNGALPSGAYHATDTVLYGATGVRLGDSTATDFVALASLVLTELQALESAFNDHTHASGALLDSTASPVTGITAGPSASYTASSVAATKVRAV